MDGGTGLGKTCRAGADACYYLPVHVLQFTFGLRFALPFSSYSPAFVAVLLFLAPVTEVSLRLRYRSLHILFSRSPFSRYFPVFALTPFAGYFFTIFSFFR